MNESSECRWVLIPPERLSEEVLIAIIEEFVTRQGTDYGKYEMPFEQQIESAKQAIKDRQVVVVFDQELEQCQLLSIEDYHAQNNADSPMK